MKLPTLPAAGASCADAAVPLPIDVEALSEGQPDGIYYAGRCLTPWMTFEERIELNSLDPVDSPAKRERYEALRTRRYGESIVVRWEIEDGKPSVPVILADMHEEGWGTYPRPQFPRAFLWGNVGHTDIWRFIHFILREEIDRSERPNNRSSNDYNEEMRTVLARACERGDGTAWILPAKTIRTMILEKDLSRARGNITRLLNEAQAAGVAVGRNADGSEVSVSVTLDRVAEVTTPELLDALCARLAFNVSPDAAAFVRNAVDDLAQIRTLLGAEGDECTADALRRVAGAKR